MKTVYLCGAINGCTDAECNDWRQRVQRDLAGQFSFLDPMRRDYRGREDESVSEIVHGDYADIDKSDIVLVAADRPSWGTAMELHQAHLEQKYTLVVCVGPRISSWLRYHATRLEPSLDLAIAALRTMA